MLTTRHPRKPHPVDTSIRDPSSFAGETAAATRCARARRRLRHLVQAYQITLALQLFVFEYRQVRKKLQQRVISDVQTVAWSG